MELLRYTFISNSSEMKYLRDDTHDIKAPLASGVIVIYKIEVKLSVQRKTCRSATLYRHENTTYSTT